MIAQKPIAALVVSGIFLVPSTVAAKRGYCGKCDTSHGCSYCLKYFGTCYPNKEACLRGKRSLLNSPRDRVATGANQSSPIRLARLQRLECLLQLPWNERLLNDWPAVEFG